MLKQYTTIMLDFDGTLVNSETVVYDALASLIRKYNFTSVTPKQLKHKQAKTVLGKLRMLLFMLKIKDEFKTLYSLAIHGVGFYDGMREVLETLVGGEQSVVILSSNNADNIQTFLSQNRISLESITILTTESLYGKHKTIKEFARSRQITTSDILYIGDELRDVRACNKAGVDIAFANWGADADEDLSSYSVKCVLQTPDELLKMV